VTRDDKQVVLLDPTKSKDEAEVVIPVERIDDEQEIGSLMPDNLMATLSSNQVNDLFRFLLNLGGKDDLPVAQRDSILEHAHAHANGPATFAFDRKPLRSTDWPSSQHALNRDRIYDFYQKQATHFRAQHHPAPLLAEHPGLDGGQHGHWGNQDDTDWEDDRWNKTRLGSVQSGIFRGAGVTVPRAVNVRLGERGEMSACFNPDTLNFDVVWTGGFVKYSSRRHGFLHGVQMDGKLHSRPKSQTPTEPFIYHGFYRCGKRTLFAYRIGDVEYLDSAWVENGKFVRQVAPVEKHPLAMLLAPVNSGNKKIETIETPITFGENSPYAVDTIQLPFENSAKSLMFVGGLAFAPDGSGMICTMQGDVWRVTNFEYPSKRARWQRFATGLNHALGMVIDKEGVFVLCRDQITRLHDQNQDGEADFYECFSNAFSTSVAGHDFICGLQRDQEGNFYTASGNQGIVRISSDGKKLDVVAEGFRNPDGLALLPDGTVTVPCSEGTWTPASMIGAARPTERTSFHGFGGPRNGNVPELPLAYIPRALDNSSGGQVVVEGDRWGPLRGQLLHLSFGMGSHFLVLRDEVDGQLQGAVVPLVGEFRSGIHRGRFNPTDGQLYVGGMQGWASWTTDDGCLQRVRYTGADVRLPIGFHVHENGVMLEFSCSLDADVAAKASSHFAQCWNYRYSGAYGSPELSTKHIGMRGHDRVAITSAHVMSDGKRLFLEMPELQPVNQLHLLVKLSERHERQLFITVHKLDLPFTSFPGFKPTNKTINPHPIVADLAMATRSIPNPFRNKIGGARKVLLETGTNLSYKTRTIRVRSGEPIEFTLRNPDVVPHNWALIKPGTMQRVGELANQLISDPEAAIRHYIPKSSDVLAHTNVVLPKDSQTIYFRAPDQPGRYPYLCTFPGHWLIMNGELIVEAK
jgi:azurin